MKAGDPVRYVPARGAPKDAVVVRHTGSGPSGYKTLDLTVGQRTHTDVPHEADADGGAHWKFGGSEHAAPAPKEEHAHVSASVVPEPTGAGRATAGVGDASEE